MFISTAHSTQLFLNTETRFYVFRTVQRDIHMWEVPTKRTLFSLMI